MSDDGRDKSLRDLSSRNLLRNGESIFHDMMFDHPKEGIGFMKPHIDPIVKKKNPKLAVKVTRVFAFSTSCISAAIPIIVFGGFGGFLLGLGVAAITNTVVFGIGYLIAGEAVFLAYVGDSGVSSTNETPRGRDLTSGIYGGLARVSPDGGNDPSQKDDLESRS